MTACGENTYENWMACGAPDDGGSGGLEQHSDDEIIQSVKRELADRYSSIDERMERVERLLAARSLSKQSPGVARTQSRSPEIEKAVAAAHANEYDSDTSDVETHSWDVVQIRKVGEDMSTLTGSRRTKQGWRWICLVLVVCALIAVAVAVPLLLKREEQQSSDVAAGTIVGSPTNQFSSPPTMAPVNQLPPECEALSDDVDICLSLELDQETASFCVDCVWKFLPDRTGYCEPLEESVCNIVRSCGCSTCQDELVAYLDCQTDCDFECSN